MSNQISMKLLEFVIWFSVIHILYYLYSQVWSDIQRIGMIHNTDNKLISQLRTKYKVTIRTFQKNTNHLGFAWFNTIYLNENLFRREKALLWTFYHEFYHLQHKHKRNVLLHRFLFSLLPFLILFHWAAWLVVYVAAALWMAKIKEVYERNANKYANEMIEKKEVSVR